MKLISIFLFTVTIGYAAYSAGVDKGQQQKEATVKATNAVMLSLGYICGSYRDRECLESMKR